MLTRSWIRKNRIIYLTMNIMLNQRKYINNEHILVEYNSIKLYNIYKEPYYNTD